ncbi:MAG: lipid A deacylase LpxR family protein, partial [Burkholderiales bacterium]|nr:lipid A deacylase LpxR family protein [Burkholderiales bacterium]
MADNALPSWQEFKQVSAAGNAVWQATIENDSLLMKKDDGFYTSGNQIEQRFVLGTAVQATTYGWRLGQELYTASDIKLRPEEIAADDHPYAGWLYAGIFREKAEATGHSLRLGLDLGCFGPCAGGSRTQTNMHRLLQQPLPQAWGAQLQREWGAVLSAEMSPGRLLPLGGVDLTPYLKARFGNIFTDAAAGASLRVGLLNTLPEQAANYGYLRAEVKAVAYNATLQGGYFNRQPSCIKPERVVGELELGYLWRAE